MTSHIPFTKSFTSSEDLVTLLCSRGLQIEDHEKAEQYLENIGYYRLSAYMYPLLQIPKTEHRYKPRATFKQVMMLLCIDHVNGKYLVPEEWYRIIDYKYGKKKYLPSS